MSYSCVALVLVDVSRLYWCCIGVVCVYIFSYTRVVSQSLKCLWSLMGYVYFPKQGIFNIYILIFHKLFDL